MSKSLGNLVFVNDLTPKVDPAALRLVLMGHHYREDWEWHDEHINEGIALLNTLSEAAQLGGSPISSSPISGSPIVSNNTIVDSQISDSSSMNSLDPRPFAQRVRAALDNDLDSPQARNVLIELAEAILKDSDFAGSAPAVLRELCELCGIHLTHPRG